MMLKGKASETTERSGAMDPATPEVMSRFDKALVDAGIPIALAG